MYGKSRFKGGCGEEMNMRIKKYKYYLLGLIVSMFVMVCVCSAEIVPIDYKWFAYGDIFSGSITYGDEDTKAGDLYIFRGTATCTTSTYSNYVSMFAYQDGKNLDALVLRLGNMETIELRMQAVVDGQNTTRYYHDCDSGWGLTQSSITREVYESWIKYAIYGLCGCAVGGIFIKGVMDAYLN